jgi:hypothetical protein
MKPVANAGLLHCLLGSFAVTLFRKAFEFCQECNADVSLMVRLKENGEIYIFNSDNRWVPSQEGLVGGFSPLFLFPSFSFTPLSGPRLFPCSFW